MDNLEDFIRQHRDDFDSERPGMELWAKIDQEINPTPAIRKPLPNIGRWAAGLLLLALCASVAFWQFFPTEKQRLTNVKPSTIMERHPEMAEIHEFFNHEINKCKGELAALGHNDPALYRDLSQLEAQFDTLRMEWGQTTQQSDQQKLLDAMIANYQHRHQLLRRVLDRISMPKGTMASSGRRNHAQLTGQ